MRVMRRSVIAAMGLILPGCALEPNLSPPAEPPAPLTQPATPATQPSDPAWDAIAKALERKGVLHEGVYTITVPRDDLEVRIEGMPMPTAAGIASVFHFYRCPCGKMN